MRRSRCSKSIHLVAGLLYLFGWTQTACAFSLVPLRQIFTSSRLFAIANSPQEFNEFSRKISTEKILGGKQNRRTSVRDFHVDLEASADECEALAKRFQLQAVATLAASLSLRPAFTGDQDIHVEGSMQASVTQTCVRTNDSFQVNVEFPIDMTVRPVLPEQTLFPEVEKVPSKNTSKSPKMKRNKKQSQRTASSSKGINDIDLFELQRLVNSDIMQNDDHVMEDEAILTVGGMLDVGELVSQLFWLSLDPYPRKPGSEWTQTSITG
ncbi:hypothetical protein MPSEU_001058600 [Mayamaea pseudoterrestris]|nr:hypothetical protein MPSEU_001058600 [Mayamaea pseudoterrestris]